MRSECSKWRKPRAEALAQAAVDDRLADVAERRVAEVVAEPDRLGEVLVEPERARDGARDLRDLERVRHARAVVIALGRDEDLRLVLQAPERLAVHDPVAVALQRRAQRAVGLLARRAAPGTSAPRAARAARPPTTRRRSAKRCATVPGALTASMRRFSQPRPPVRRRPRFPGGAARLGRFRVRGRGEDWPEDVDAPTPGPPDRAASPRPPRARRRGARRGPGPASSRSASWRPSVDPNVILLRLEDAIDNLRTWLLVIGLVAVAALGVAIYAVARRRHRRAPAAARRPALASDERVSQIENRVDRLSRQLQDVRTDGARQRRRHGRARQARIDELESADQVAVRPGGAASGTQDAIDELSSRIDDLAGDVEQLKSSQATP